MDQFAWFGRFGAKRTADAGPTSIDEDVVAKQRDDEPPGSPAASEGPRSDADLARLGQQELLRRELDVILGSAGQDATARAKAEQSLWGLALSGGGIRSATFALGVLQSLAKRDWLGGFHYLSTVSGGGYVGAYLQGLVSRKRDGLKGACDELTTTRTDGSIRQLRCYSNFLAPDKASFSADRTTFASVYAGNLLLIQAQLLAWLMLFLSIPLLIFPLFKVISNHPFAAFGVALLLTSSAMYWRGRLQLKAERDQRAGGGNSDATCRPRPSRWTLAAAPALLSSGLIALTACLLGGDNCRVIDGCDILTNAPGFQTGRMMGALIIYASGFATWQIWWRKLERERRRFSTNKPDAEPATRQQTESGFGPRFARHFAGLLFGLAALSAALTGLFFHREAPWRNLPTDMSASGSYTWWVMILGVPIVFLIVFSCSTLHAGIAFDTAAERLPRERWSRIMGRCAVILLGITAAMALVSIGPWAVSQVGPWAIEKVAPGFEFPIANWAVPVLAILLSGIGARAAYFDGQRNGQRNWLVRTATSAVIALAPIALVIGVLLLAIMLAQEIVGASSKAGELNAHLAGLAVPLQGVVMLFGIWTIAYLFSVFIDENECSMNGFYRNRLVRCYLAPSNDGRQGDPETDQDPVRDDILLCELVPHGGEARPLYPLVCAAANLTETADLDWQDRRAASFIFSPLHCGYVPTSKRLWAKPLGDLLPVPLQGSEESSPGGRRPPLASTISLGTAIATSGAAVSPNMGYHSSAPVAFLLTLFNARLGWWIDNHNASPNKWKNLGSKLLSELWSRTNDTAEYTYVSDGGHFENLGIYELVRRKCRFIVCVDASADPDRDFDSLGNAIHKCRVDFDASIDIDVSLMRPDNHGVSKRGAVLGKIRYNSGDDDTGSSGEDACTGLLLYIKPSITGGESADIARYASANVEFPHEPTHDQFFDEHQFEAYRQLGESMGDRLFSLGGEHWELVRAGRKGELPRKLDLFSDKDKEGLLLRLEHWLFEPSDATALRFTTHGAALCRLLERQRQDRKLESLDGQLNAGWAKAGGKAGQLGLPQDKHFRPCFYFVQEVIQLMEAVYLDLDLERNFNHPDNRGWMNLFRQWTWVPMFRVVWALTSQSLGSRFVHFCEEVLGAPQVSSALEMDWEPDVTSLNVLADRWSGTRDISSIEDEILRSDYLAKKFKESARMAVGRMFINWDKIFGCKAKNLKLKNLDVGLVVAISAESGEGVAKNPNAPLKKIIVGRVQDHVRRMGFGAEMIYLALVGERSSIDEASVEKEDYGETIGPLEQSTADRQSKELQEMLKRARRRRGLLPDKTATREGVAT